MLPTSDAGEEPEEKHFSSEREPAGGEEDGKNLCWLSFFAFL
jgi:hypothetical protein